MNIQGAIITIDAMGTQKAIARQIIAAEADYVLALKGNQGKLHSAVIADVDEQIENDFADVAARRYVTKGKGHGREETRIDIQMPASKSLPGWGLWKCLKTIGVVVSLCVRNGKETTEMRYDISSLAVSVKLFARAVRGQLGH